MSARIALAASLALALSVSAPPRTGAQGVAPAVRVIPLPDTLGANFPLADSATKTGSPADYDTLVGTWTFRFQTRQPDGFKAPITGHWTFEKKPGGGLVEDRFRPDDPSLPMGVSDRIVAMTMAGPGFTISRFSKQRELVSKSERRFHYAGPPTTRAA